MAVLIDAMHALSVLNVLLLAGLGYVWGRNFYRFRSKHTLGLLVFAVLLLAENALAIYLFVFNPDLTVWINTASLVPPIAQRAMLALRALEFAGIVFLTWVTWD
ncbi:hypothetical protein [Halococcus saccharolyticus]|uniref:Uncharacterized protein n=1 Tax=Halococcus saccharolyticus DSM 5350 TaxID=1227455 RepID=M0MLS3_9EURY|nr:hypothetical protein [Halococcus saccharolyticus]EMA45395.1 hypothetical protein C449_07210 [Halococcus saccharolyticus DSM 5350]